VLDGSDVTKNRDKLWQWLHNISEYGICLLTNMGTEKTAYIEVSYK